MTEHVKQRHLLEIDRVPHAWTVTFDINSISPDGVREDLARNMVANVAVGGERVRNDFDKVSIFQRPIFNATWDSNKRRWVDFVAQGEEGFTFSPTEANREVIYRCKPFWYKLGFKGAYGPNYVSVSDQPLEGYKLAPMFKNGTTYEYRPCFELAIGSDGKPHSRAGLVPYEDKPTALMNKVRTYASDARVEVMADWFCDYLLLLVEFGTRNLQGVMRGFTPGPKDMIVNYDVPGFEDGLYTSYPERFEVGKIYRMMIYGAVQMMVLDTELLEIGEEENESQCRLYFDVEDQDTFVKDEYAYLLYDRPAITGEALTKVTGASSGVADSRYYSPCVWRGKENPWGNMSSFICNVLFDVTGTRGKYYPYKLDDLSLFDGKLNSAYTKCSYKSNNTIEGEKSYIVSFMAADEDWFLVPADFNRANPQHYFAARVRIYISNRPSDPHYLRVGGDYVNPDAVNHATYEIITDQLSTVKFGGRLILEEEG